jgi:hypothetical protein
VTVLYMLLLLLCKTYDIPKNRSKKTSP